MKRICLGFDLRLNANLQKENTSQIDQHLVPELRSPMSADAGVWLEPGEIAALTKGILPDFANPLHLAKSIDLLVDACAKTGISTSGLWGVCLTSFESNVIALEERFGPGYFDNRPTDLSHGWELAGFDVVGGRSSVG
jgi:hypothetical protein